MDIEICKLCYEGAGEAVVALLTRDLKVVSQKDSSGRQGMHWAASGGHWSICDLLVTKGGAAFDEADDSGWTPLMIAGEWGGEWRVS